MSCSKEEVVRFEKESMHMIDINAFHKGPGPFQSKQVRYKP